MVRLSDRNDLRRHVSELMGSSADEASIDAAVDWIYGDASRPRYGDDWQDYFDSIDLWKAAAFWQSGGE